MCTLNVAVQPERACPRDGLQRLIVGIDVLTDVPRVYEVP